jgi:hypothetical protein
MDNALVRMWKEKVTVYFKFYYLFFMSLSGVRLNPLGTAATTGLLYSPRWYRMVIVVQLVE